jgi:hypothetical protein
MQNVTVDKLKKIYKEPGEAEAKFREVALTGGFGDVQTYDGGLDLTGIFDPENKAIKESSLNKILSIVAPGEEDATREKLSGVAAEQGPAEKAPDPTPAKKKGEAK